MTADMGEDNKKGDCVQHVCILIKWPCFFLGFLNSGFSL